MPKKDDLVTWANAMLGGRGRRGGGTEFKSQEALASYLRAHPAADASKHSVVVTQTREGERSVGREGPSGRVVGREIQQRPGDTPTAVRPVAPRDASFQSRMADRLSAAAKTPSDHASAALKHERAARDHEKVASAAHPEATKAHAAAEAVRHREAAAAHSKKAAGAKPNPPPFGGPTLNTRRG